MPAVAEAVAEVILEFQPDQLLELEAMVVEVMAQSITLSLNLE
jgi:hypothetical protein